MIEIIQLDGYRNGPRRIAHRVAAERDRVASFNAHMVESGKPHRATMWQPNFGTVLHDFFERATANPACTCTTRGYELCEATRHHDERSAR